ncbi:MAG: hypothetical protein RL007_866 [Bacteroidota bacterium]
MSSIFESFTRLTLMNNQGGKYEMSIPKIGMASHFLKGFVYVLPLLDKTISLQIEGNVAEVTGYTADEFTQNGMLVEQLIAEEDRANYILERNRIIDQSSSEKTLKYRLKHKTVGFIQIAEKVLVQYNNNGEAEFLIGYLEDKTVDVLNAVSMRQLLAFREAIDRFLICTITDPEGTIIYANRKFSKRTGYPIKEVLGRTHDDLIGSATHDEKFWSSFWSTIKSGKKWAGVVLNISKSGEKYWEEKVVIPVLGNDGTVLNYISLGNDVTSRFEMERKLRFFKEAIDVSPDMMFLVDSSDFRILDVNSTAEKTLGYSSENLTEMNLPHVLAELSSNELRYIVDETHKSGSTKGVFETKLITSSRELIASEFVFSIYHSDKWGDRIIFSVRDISRKKEMELEIETHKSGMIEIAKLAKMGTWEWRPKDGLIILSGPAASILELGQSEMTMDFSEFQKMIHPGDLHLLEKAIERIFNQDEPAAFNYRIATQDGSEKHLSLKRYNIKVGSDNTVVAVQGFAQDISDIRRTQIENEYYHEKMEQLVFQTSHHLRASISTILGVLEVFKSGNPAEVESGKLLSYISEAATDADDNLRLMFRRLQETQSLKK